jgi:molecular chaperone GrpE
LASPDVVVAENTSQPEVDAAQLQVERDELLDLVRRVQADFSNYKRRVDERREQERDWANAELASKLLVVLDACDAAGSTDVSVIGDLLTATMAGAGLERIDEAGVSFDPTVHDAVSHIGGDGGAVVVEVLRAGYTWNGRVLRAAMVVVEG